MRWGLTTEVEGLSGPVPLTLTTAYSLNCHVGDMLVSRMLCRITQSSDAHRTESVSVMDHEQTMGVNSRVLDQKQQNIFGRISLFWSVELQGHPEQLNGGDHDWLIQTPVSTVQRGMLKQPGT